MCGCCGHVWMLWLCVDVVVMCGCCGHVWESCVVSVSQLKMCLLYVCSYDVMNKSFVMCW